MTIGKPVQASNAEISKLETAHKNQLAILAQANNFILNGLKSAKTQKQLDVLRAYSKKIFPIAQAWHRRQYELEANAKIPKQRPEFFNPSTQASVNDMIGDINAENKLGFIPLLIWAGIAIAGFFTTSYVVNQLNDTAQEKQDLIRETSNVCKELNISAEQCQKLLVPTVENKSSGGIWGIITPIALAAAAFYAVTNRKKIIESFK